MCGIIGYSGSENAVDILLGGLQALEYRGYDSSGIAFFRSGGIEAIKTVGKLANLKELVDQKGSSLQSNCGIGHTRWATHGKPSDLNAHPHSTRNLSLVHNGIIENYLELKQWLAREKGYSFLSETDTEIAAKLLDFAYLEVRDPLRAIRKCCSQLKGSYAFGVIFKDYPGEIYVTRKDSPLICAMDEKGSFVASDIPAVLRHTNRYYTLEEGEIAVLRSNEISFFDSELNPTEKTVSVANWAFNAADKGEYDHFMLKEIMEEPDVLRNTISPRLENGLIDLKIDGLSDAWLSSFHRVVIVACGTAMHAGMIGKYAIEKLAGVPVSVEIASEFRYCDPIITKDDLVILISQSGETADTLATLRLAKQKGATTLAVVNVVGSTLSREADLVFYTLAGPEIAVASTKAYSVQLAAMYLLAVKLALVHGSISEQCAHEYGRILLEEVPSAVEELLNKKEDLIRVSETIKSSDHLFFIGRGVDYALSMEGSLKLKEITYIHSEAYAAGELKHGTISLITDGVPVIAIATDDACFEKMRSNIKEVRARGAVVILICKETTAGTSDIADFIIPVPGSLDVFTSFTVATVFQLIAYYTSVLRGCDVDKPRNLAKSVTVE